MRRTLWLPAGKPARSHPAHLEQVLFVRHVDACASMLTRAEDVAIIERGVSVSPRRDGESYDIQLPFMGFGSLRRLQKRAATYAGFPTPAVQRLQVFSTS